MRVLFRTDASSKIGTGHVMRCLSLAQELKQKQCEVSFISRLHDGNLNAYIRSQGFECIDLRRKTIDSENEYEKWLGLSQLEDAEEFLKLSPLGGILIVDHYGLDQTWETKLRPYFEKIVVIDDLANRKHECDLLIDQNLQPALHKKYPQLVSASAQLCLGPLYALLRPEFAVARKKMTENKVGLERVLIFFGGNDASNESLKALKACLKISSIKKIDLVLGVINFNKNELLEFSKSYPQVEIHENVKQMSVLMLKADLAFGAGGVTTWERACLGLPCITWSLAENQESLLKAMHEAKALIYLGLYQEAGEEKILKAIKSLEEHPQQLLELSQNAKSLVDGQGLGRVASALLNLVNLEKKIELREVENKDKKNIFEWRNHPDTRRYSHDSTLISWAVHEAWFEKCLNNPQRILLIAESEGQPVGVLRYDLSETEALTSIYLVPGKSGKSYGSQILKQGSEWMKQKYPQIKLFKAEIRDDNLASQKAFSKAGYICENKIWVKHL